MCTALGLLFSCLAIVFGLIGLALRDRPGDAALPAYLSLSFSVLGLACILLPRVM